jgi:hypothetical protein
VLIGELGRRPPPPSASGPNFQGKDSFVMVGADGQRHTFSHADYERMAGTACYSLNLPHEAEYEAVLLESVSREMVHIRDAEDGEEGRSDEEAIGAAVAFRWRGVPGRA